LFVGDREQAVYMSNRGEAPQVLANGVYVVSNGLMSEDWEKTKHLRKRFTQEFLPMLQQSTITESDLQYSVWDILEDERKIIPDLLPDTGISVEMEELLSSTFIQSPIYGTLCSNFLRMTSEHLTVDISELSGKCAYLFLLCNLFGYDLITHPDHTLQRPYQHSDTADRRNCQKQQQPHDLNADTDSSFSLSCIIFFPLSFSLIHTLLLYATNKYHQKGLRHKSAGPLLIR
jgi:hypothetical protein